MDRSCGHTEQSWSWGERKCCWVKHFLEHHFPFPALGANPGVDSGDAFEEVLPGQSCFLLILLGLINPEESDAPRHFGFSVSDAQDPIMPDFDESIGQDVEEKTPNELGCIQDHELDLIVVVAISIFEGHFIAFDLDQTVVGDGYPVAVSPQILHEGFGIAERGFAVYVPLLPVEGGQERFEFMFLFQVSDIAWERDLAFMVSLFEISEELSPEQAREDLHGQEEVFLARNPSLAVRG